VGKMRWSFSAAKTVSDLGTQFLSYGWRLKSKVSESIVDFGPNGGSRIIRELEKEEGQGQPPTQQDKKRILAKSIPKRKKRNQKQKNSCCVSQRVRREKKGHHFWGGQKNQRGNKTGSRTSPSDRRAILKKIQEIDQTAKSPTLSYMGRAIKPWGRGGGDKDLPGH